MSIVERARVEEMKKEMRRLRVHWKRSSAPGGTMTGYITKTVPGPHPDRPDMVKYRVRSNGRSYVVDPADFIETIE